MPLIGLVASYEDRSLEPSQGSECQVQGLSAGLSFVWVLGGNH